MPATDPLDRSIHQRTVAPLDHNGIPRSLDLSHRFGDSHFNPSFYSVYNMLRRTILQNTDKMERPKKNAFRVVEEPDCDQGRAIISGEMQDTSDNYKI